MAVLFDSGRCAPLEPADLKFQESLPHPGRDFAFLQRDHLKTVLAAPMRRLQQKTQVFPLDVTSSARSRLTHSLETAEYCRLLTLILCSRSVELAPLQQPLELVTSTAALLHDLGNPPFGHFGEAVIRRFLTDTAARFSSYLTHDEQLCLCSFNGNAQGLRIIHSIQQLNLCLGQLGAAVKVPATAPELAGLQSDPCRAGVFLSEAEVLSRLRRHFPAGTRHPAAQIMDLCDDLAYSLADLEDGADKGLIAENEVFELFCRLQDTLGLDLKLPPRADFARSYARSRRGLVGQVREVTALAYLEEVSAAIADRLDEFLSTGFLDVSALRSVQAVQILKEFELHTLYSSPEVEGLELSGQAYLSFLLAAYGRLLEFSADEFAALQAGSLKADPYCRRLCRRISRRHQEAYLRHIARCPQQEFYARVRLVVDYISGMTDTYAGVEYRLLRGLL